MTGPHALHGTNRADPSFRPPDLRWYKAALTEGLQRGRSTSNGSRIGFLGLHLLNGNRTLTTAIVHMHRTRSKVDRQALARRHGWWHGIRDLQGNWTLI